MSIVSTYRAEQQSKRDLIRIIAVLLDALGGEYVITKDKFETKIRDDGEVRFHQSMETDALRIKFIKSGIY